jgi:hypothetical protein
VSGLDDSKPSGASDRMRPLTLFTKQLLEDGGKYSDITLVVDGAASCLTPDLGTPLDHIAASGSAGQKIRAHKTLLVRSPYFEAMFDRFQESKESSVEIKDVDAQVSQRVIKSIRSPNDGCRSGLPQAARVHL